MVNLSDQQQAGIEKIRQWYHGTDGFGADVFPLFGPAGTGKTTMAKAIPAALGATNVRYGTFTGKAAHVLRGKGASPVSTIHSAIYFPTMSAEAQEALQAARAELADALGGHRFGRPVETATIEARIATLEAQIPALEADTRRLSWEWNPESEWARADLIILDEVSMVGAKLAADIEAYGVPIIVLGDPAQLPPVEGGGYYTDRRPAWELTEVHRQALESPVLELATRIRTSTGERLGMAPADLSNPSLAEAMAADQVLVWSNKRRWTMVNAMRRKLGREPGSLVQGDRIMCLTNNKDMAVFNGQQFDVMAADQVDGVWSVQVRDEDGVERLTKVWTDGFMGQEVQVNAKNAGMGMRGQTMLATYAQAITVHKAQGSEWPWVYVVNETPTMIWATGRNASQAEAISQARRWAYTAVTRASERVTVTAPRRG